VNPRRLTARVEGHVQGVGYRAFVQREARRLGLRGYVRNLRDGAVEAVAEGDEPVLRELAEALSRGPAGSHVTRVHADWADPTGEFRGFEVRY
jgi:acylphosphatase